MSLKKTIDNDNFTSNFTDVMLDLILFYVQNKYINSIYQSK